MTVWRRFGRDERGSFIILFAAAICLAAIISAFVIDAASLYHERRTLQRGVDLAAIQAAQDSANSLTVAHASLVEAGLIGPSATLAVLASQTGGNALRVERGHYRANSDIDAMSRFQPGVTPFNAVRVYYEHPGQLYFSSSWSPVPTISASAIATVTPEVAFSVVSRLAKLDGGIANAVLNKLLGSDVALTAVDYNGLAGAKIDAFAFLDALAFQLGITAGTYDDILAASADHGQIGAAIADLLSGPQKFAALKVANAAGGNGEILLSKLFSVGDVGQAAIGSIGGGAFTPVSALDLLSASAGLSDRTHNVDMSLTAGLPGLVGIGLTLAVGEPAQGGSRYAIGPVGTVVRTAQVRLRIVASLKLKILLLSLVDVNLPLYLDVAHAEAIVTAASCPTAGAPFGSATIAARPGVAQIILGEVNADSFDDFGSSPWIGAATLVNALGIEITGSAHAEVAQTDPVSLVFSSPEIAAGTLKTARTTSFTGSLVSSLFDDLELTVAGIGQGVVSPLIHALLAPLVPTLDLTIATLLETLGLSLGEADVQVYGVRCQHGVLVG